MQMELRSRRFRRETRALSDHKYPKKNWKCKVVRCVVCDFFRQYGDMVTQVKSINGPHSCAFFTIEWKEMEYNVMVEAGLTYPLDAPSIKISPPVFHPLCTNEGYFELYASVNWCPVLRIMNLLQEVCDLVFRFPMDVGIRLQSNDGSIKDNMCCIKNENAWHLLQLDRRVFKLKADEVVARRIGNYATIGYSTYTTLQKHLKQTEICFIVLELVG